METMKKSRIISIMIMLVSCQVLCAQDMARINVQKGELSVCVNGFPMRKVNVDRAGETCIISPYLVTGQNKVSVEFTPMDPADQTTQFSVKLFQMATAPAQPVELFGLNQKYVCSFEVVDRIDNVVFVKGSYDAGSSEFGFFHEGDQHILEFTLAAESAFNTCPSVITLNGLNGSVAAFEVTVSAADGSTPVTFENVPVVAADGEHQLDLSNLTPSAGGGYILNKNFARLRLSVKNPELTSLSMSGIRIPSNTFAQLKETFMFDAEVTDQWEWVSAENLPATLGQEDNAAVIDKLQELHTAVNSGNADDMSSLLDLWCSEAAVALKREPGAFTQAMTSAVASHGQKLMPIDLSKVETKVLTNGKVVVIDYEGRDSALQGGTHADSDGVASTMVMHVGFIKVLVGDSAEWKVTFLRF